MFCKLTFGDKNKIFKLLDNQGVEDIRGLAVKYYPQIKSHSFDLYYLDEDEDKIIIKTDKDIFQHRKLKHNLKIFIVVDPHRQFKEQFSKIGLKQSQDRPQNRYLQELSQIEKLSIQSKQVEKDQNQSSVLYQGEQNQRLIMKRQQVHHIECSGCNNPKIIGIRYQCVYCFGFNLCEACQRQFNHEHPLLKVKTQDKKLDYEHLRDHLNLMIPANQSVEKMLYIQELEQRCRNFTKLIQESDKDWIKQDVKKMDEKLRKQSQIRKQQLNYQMRQDSNRRYQKTYQQLHNERSRQNTMRLRRQFQERQRHLMRKQLQLKNRLYYPTYNYYPFPY